MKHHAAPKRPRAFTITTPTGNPHSRPVLRFRGHRAADAIGRHDVRAAVRQWEGML